VFQFEAEGTSCTRHLSYLGGSTNGDILIVRNKMSMAAGTFRWTQAFSVEIAHLDRQHQQLFDTVNELDQALRAGEGNAVVDPVLNKLVDYALVHFAAEEVLMEKHDFPGLSSHRAQHEAFRDKIAAFLEDHKASKAGVPVSLMLFLQNWLKEHVLRVDKQYTAFLNARGVH